MTVKEQLIERVRTLSEEDAARVLEILPPIEASRLMPLSETATTGTAEDGAPRTGLPALDARLAEIAAHAPPEALDRFPPDFPENLDRHLYELKE